jgi:hypothetical protein
MTEGDTIGPEVLEELLPGEAAAAVVAARSDSTPRSAKKSPRKTSRRAARAGKR